VLNVTVRSDLTGLDVKLQLEVGGRTLDVGALGHAGWVLLEKSSLVRVEGEVLDEAVLGHAG
jgi:hypothetical protein